MTKKQNEIKTPYTIKELYKLAENAANKHKIPEIYREDAIAEFVAAGFAAIERSKETIRGYQYTRGRGAMLNFLKREIKCSELTPNGCTSDATKISLDMPVPGIDGEYTTLAETIIDNNNPTPDKEAIRKEKKAAVQAALAMLEINEAEAVRRVWMMEETQDQAAKAMGITRDKIRTLLDKAKERLQNILAKYKYEYRW